MPRRIQPTGPGGCSEERRCSLPTRLLHNLEAAGLRIESFDTLCSVEARTSTRWCGASYPPPIDQLAQRRLEDVSPEVRVQRVHLLPVVVQRVSCPTMRVILHQHPHQLILGGQ
jgi:hypothetical protein